MMNYETWFNESKKIARFVELDEHSFIIYKGFKLTRYNDNSYKLEDVSKSDFYDKVSSNNLEVIMDLGFIKGIDYITHQKNLKRFKKEKERLEDLYSKKIELENSNIKKSAYDKNLALYNRSINDSLDQMFLYKFKIGQYEKKNNN